MNSSLKFLLPALALVLGFALTHTRAAEDPEGPPAPPPSGKAQAAAPNQPPPPPHHGPRAERGDRLKHLARYLELTDAQKNKIAPILKEEIAAMKALRTEQANDREAQHAKMKALRESYRAKIRAELTPAQQAKLDQLPERPRPPRGEDPDLPPKHGERHETPPPEHGPDDEAPAATAQTK